MRRRQPSLAVVVPWTILVVLTAIGGLVLWLTDADDSAPEPVTFDLDASREPLPAQGRVCYAGFLAPDEQEMTYALVDVDAGEASVAVLYGNKESELLTGQGPLEPVASTENVFEMVAEVPTAAGNESTIPIPFTLAGDRLALPGEAVLAVADCATLAAQVATIDASRQG